MQNFLRSEHARQDSARANLVVVSIGDVENLTVGVQSQVGGLPQTDAGHHQRVGVAAVHVGHRHLGWYARHTLITPVQHAAG